MLILNELNLILVFINQPTKFLSYYEKETQFSTRNVNFNIITKH